MMPDSHPVHQQQKSEKVLQPRNLFANNLQLALHKVNSQYTKVLMTKLSLLLKKVLTMGGEMISQARTEAALLLLESLRKKTS